VERAIRHGSHLLSALVDANAIAMVPDGAQLKPGDVVRLMILDAEQLGSGRQV
jgi:molybdopterin biosynthesis enzyme